MPTLQHLGVVGRDDCTDAVGPHSRRSLNADTAAIASEPIRMHTHTENWTNEYITGYSHGDRPHMAIADVHHTCHIMSGQMYEEEHDTTFLTPSTQVRSEAENA